MKNVTQTISGHVQIHCEVTTHTYWIQDTKVIGNGFAVTGTDGIDSEANEVTFPTIIEAIQYVEKHIKIMRLERTLKGETSIYVNPTQS